MKEDPSAKESDFGYMEELSKAYEAALAKRLTRPSLPEEKRAAVASMQREISEAAERVYPSAQSEEKKELLTMLKESAHECLTLLEAENLPSVPSRVPDAFLLSRAVILANRTLNLLVRHTKETSPLVFIILSELSALYALAAIR